MNRDELLALADRVEALTGPDRETDKAILLTLGYSWRGMAYWFHDDSRQWKGDTHFTASLDAAMSLVPSDSWHEIKGPRKYLNIPTPSPNYWSAHLARWNHEFQVAGWGATAAIALCAAALRALAHQSTAAQAGEGAEDA